MIRGIQGQGRGPEEVQHVEGQQLQRDGGHVEAGERGEDRVEEVHERSEEDEPRRHLSPSGE